MSKKHDTNVGAMTAMSRDRRATPWMSGRAHRINRGRRALHHVLAYFLCTRYHVMASGALMWSGCLVSPPLQLDEPFENHPPFIKTQSVFPQTTTVVASSDSSVTLGVEALYDQDQERELFYAWYSATLGTISTGQVEPLDEAFTTRVDGIFNAYGGISQEISPCQVALRGRQSETLWLYVTDRKWTRTDSVGVEIDDGAFLASWSWVLDLRDVVCGG